jgi:endoglucanase
VLSRRLPSFLNTSLLLLGHALCAASYQNQKLPSKQIKVDQAGYLPDGRKSAFIAVNGSGSPLPQEFIVRRMRDGSEAFRGKLLAPVSDPDAGDQIQAADFTQLSETGRYFLDVPGVGVSWDFTIAPDVLDRVYYLAARSFYGQRCGTAVDLGPEFPNFKHGACHLQGEYHPSSGKQGPHVSSHGWHDAGDYGRYVVNSGISTATLLWASELFGNRINSVVLHIAESGNGVPDILNEARWNLEWMASMQDTDGGVWHKQTSTRFSGFIMPEQDKLVSNVIGTGKDPFKSSCATADFAAVMAIAARVYKPFDVQYAARSLQAAKSAWAWLNQHPDVTFQNPSGIATGEYGDRNCRDEHLWAAAELARTTDDPIYDQYFVGNYRPFLAGLRDDQPPSWSNVGDLALWTYALSGRGDTQAVKEIVERSLAAADGIAKRASLPGYNPIMTTKDYIWGSNGVAANYGMQLLIANWLKPDPVYREAALDNLHYVLGRNTHSLSFVTQVGENAFLHPHHRPSAADGVDAPWPGLLSGGPNAGRQDPEMKRSVPAGLPPAKSYIDATAAYACNEVAINWNAPLVFVLAEYLQTR